MRRSLEQLDVCALGHAVSRPSERDGTLITPDVSFRTRRDPADQHAGAAAELEHSPRKARCPNMHNRLVEPLAHLIGRYRLTRVAADVPRAIELPVRRGVLIESVPDLPPPSDAIVRPSRRRFTGGHQIADQP